MAETRLLSPSPLAWVRRSSREPTILLLVAQLSAALTAALANILIARALAPSGRGYVALLLQVGYLASQVLLFGTERSFIAGFSGSSPAVAVRAYGRLVAVPCGAALLAAGVAAVVAPPGLHGLRLVAVLVAAFAVVNVLALALRSIAIATGRYRDFVVCVLAGLALLLAGMAVLYATGLGGPAEWFGVYVVSGGLSTAACWLLWSRMTGGAQPTVDDERRRAVRREGLALFPAAVANMGMLRIDRLVLPALASTAALGLYATVSTMTQLLAWPLQAYADSRIGVWREAHGHGRLRPSPVALSAAVYTLVVAPLLGFATYLLIVPLFGESFAAARALVAPLVGAAALYGVSRVTLAKLIAQGRNLLASAAETCGFLVSLAAYVVLIPPHGALGAAWGSLVGYAVCLLLAAAVLRAGSTGAVPAGAATAAAEVPAQRAAP